jgi:hypothetical protein
MNNSIGDSVWVAPLVAVMSAASVLPVWEMVGLVTEICSSPGDRRRAKQIEGARRNFSEFERRALGLAGDGRIKKPPLNRAELF